MSKNPFIKVACCTSKTRRSGALVALANRSCGLIDAKVASSVPYKQQIINFFKNITKQVLHIYLHRLEGKRGLVCLRERDEIC